MKYNLTIQSEDYGFIKEAIKLRTLAILESMDAQVASHFETAGPCSVTAAPVKAEGAPVSFTVNATNKKPHWTQTPAGKKKMAARKNKGTK